MEMAFDSVANELNLIEANLVLSSRDYTKEEYDKMITTTTFDNIERYSILRQSDFECKENYYRQEYIDFLHLEFDPDVNHYFTIVALGKKEYNEYIKKKQPRSPLGMDMLRAFLVGALSGIVEPIAAALPLLALAFVAPLMPYLLSFAAGAMMCVVVEELVPDLRSAVGTLSFTLGFVMMMALDVALG